VDADYFKDTLLPTLSDLGYEGFQTIGSDGTDQGLASFFKKAAFDIVRQKTVANNDIVKEVCKEIGQEDLLEHLTMPTYVLMMALRHKDSGNLIAIGEYTIEHPDGKSCRMMMTYHHIFTYFYLHHAYALPKDNAFRQTPV